MQNKKIKKPKNILKLMEGLEDGTIKFDLNGYVDEVDRADVLTNIYVSVNRMLQNALPVEERGAWNALGIEDIRKRWNSLVEHANKIIPDIEKNDNKTLRKAIQKAMKCYKQFTDGVFDEVAIEYRDVITTEGTVHGSNTKKWKKLREMTLNTGIWKIETTSAGEQQLLWNTETNSLQLGFEALKDNSVLYGPQKQSLHVKKISFIAFLGKKIDEFLMEKYPQGLPYLYYKSLVYKNSSLAYCNRSLKKENIFQWSAPTYWTIYESEKDFLIVNNSLSYAWFLDYLAREEYYEIEGAYGYWNIAVIDLCEQKMKADTDIDENEMTMKITYAKFMSSIQATYRKLQSFENWRFTICSAVDYWQLYDDQHKDDKRLLEKPDGDRICTAQYTGEVEITAFHNLHASYQDNPDLSDIVVAHIKKIKT